MPQGTRPPTGRGSPPPPSTAAQGAGLGGAFTNPAAGWVNSLAKASRAFILYDPGNAVIRQFLADYADKAKRALERGPLVLDIAPHEIRSGGEVVYREPDRERSLAFRLFRDGVRRLTIDPAVHWEELLLFLQILALRFTGIQQQEEDIVTLLWKAEFKAISVQVVQGFASEDEEPAPASGVGSGDGKETSPDQRQGDTGPGGPGSGDGGEGSGSKVDGDPMSRPSQVGQDLARAADAASAAAAMAGEALRSEPPPRWDEPLPRLTQPVAIAHRPVAAENMRSLLADEAPEALPTAVLRAVRDLLAEATRSGWSMPDADLDQFVKEARIFLLGEGELSALMELAGMVGLHQGGAAVETDLLHELGDPRTVETILRGIPDDATEPPPKLAPVLALVRLDAVLELLAAEKRPARRTMLLGLARGRLPEDGEVLLSRLPSLDPALGLQLLTTLAERDPERAARGVSPLLGHPSREIRLAALQVLEGSQGELPPGPLFKLLRTAEDEPLRVRVLQLLGSKGEPSAFEGVEKWGEERRELSLPEADALGRALAQLAPIPAARLFARWLHPEKSVFKAIRDAGHRRALVWATASGLGALPGAGAQQQLEALAQEASGDLRKHCLGVLARRRREGVSRG